MPIPPLSPLSPVDVMCEAVHTHRTVVCRWVAVGIVGASLMLRAGLGWYYSRQWRQAASSQVLAQAPTADVVRLIKLALSLKKLRRALTPSEALTLVPLALDAYQIASASALAPSPPSPRLNGLKRWLSRIDSLESPSADPHERAGHLVELARLVAPLTPLSERLVTAELLAGSVDAVATARDSAVFRLRRFCMEFGLSPPHGVMNAFAWARVVPHDAPHLSAFTLTRLQCEDFTHWVLCYRPDRLALGYRPPRGGPNPMGAFCHTWPLGETPLDPRSEAAGRAVLKVLLSQAIAPLARQWRERAPGFWAQLSRSMEAVWGEGGGPADLPREFVNASARLLADVVWGQHVGIGYSDRWGLVQLVSCALVTLPQKQVALRAWLTHEPAAADFLGDAMLGAARLFEHSIRCAGD